MQEEVSQIKLREEWMAHYSHCLSELDLEELTGGYVLPSLAGSCSTSIKVLIMKEMSEDGINKKTCFRTHAAEELQILVSKPRISRFLWNWVSLTFAWFPAVVIYSPCWSIYLTILHLHFYDQCWLTRSWCNITSWRGGVPGSSSQQNPRGRPWTQWLFT